MDPEVNWPLREGPHSPAGKSVAVDEEAQADFLVRYYLLAGGTGLVERVYWWQLVARGYGLCDPQPDGSLRERPSFTALATLIRELAGTICHGALPASILPPGARALRFTRGAGGTGEEIVVAWSTADPIAWAPGTAPHRIVHRDGGERAVEAGVVRLSSSASYIFFPAS